MKCLMANSSVQFAYLRRVSVLNLFLQICKASARSSLEALSKPGEGGEGEGGEGKSHTGQM